MTSDRFRVIQDRVADRDDAQPLVVIDKLSEEFIDRLRATMPPRDEVDLARERYGDDLPDDVIEELARQAAAARPLLEQYHIFSENTPTLALAYGTMMKDIDAITDIVTAMDLTDLGDVGEFPDEYTCPKCAHRWSGAPNFRTGYGDKVYIPTGRVSSKTGKVQSKRYGPPVKTVRDFKYGRNWRGSSAAKLPRGFGNRDIGTAIVSENWRKRKKKE